VPNTPLTYTVYQNTYPFINRITPPGIPIPTAPQSYPLAWPVVTSNPLPVSAMLALFDELELFDLELDEPDLDDSITEDENDDEMDGDETSDEVVNENTDADNTDTDATENTDSDADNIIDSPEGVVAAVGAITLIGGYGFTRTEPFKSLIRRSNARAIRRINEHNDRKRRK